MIVRMPLFSKIGGSFLVPTGFFHHESGSARQWGWGVHTVLGRQLSARASPPLFQWLPHLCSFFCLAWYLDSKNIQCVCVYVSLCACVCVSLCVRVCWWGWAPSTLTFYWAQQLTTATPHVIPGPTYDSCWSGYWTTLTSMQNIGYKSSWLWMYHFPCG